jgi:hypothetical protein
MTSKLPADAFDPKQNPSLGDPNLMKEYQEALRQLKQLKQDDHIFTYLVEPKRTGSVSVPAFTVSVNGQRTATEPIGLQVREPKPQNLARIALSLSDPQPLVGQEVQLFVDVLVRRESVQLNGRSFPHLPLKDVYVSLPALEGQQAVELVRPLSEVIAEHAPAQGHRGYRISGVGMEAVFQMEPPGAGEAGWYRRRLALPIRLREAGKTMIAAARVAGDAYVPANPAAKGSAARGGWTAFAASSPCLEFEVRPLPADANQPRGFSGNIGELRISASASQTRLAVGTPFTLTVRVEGKDYLPKTAGLELEKQAEFPKRFRIRLEQDRAVSDKAREVTYTLRPLDGEVTSVPPMTMTYFDPKSAQYKTASSEPIALQVTPGTRIDAGASVNDPPAPKNELSIAQTESSLPPLDDQAGFWTRGRLAQVAVGAGGITVAVVLAGGYLVRGVRRLRDRRRQTAVRDQHERNARSACKQLRSVDLTLAGVRQTIHLMLREQFAMPPGEITPQDAEARLHSAGVPQHLAKKCSAILEACAAAEFAPGAESVSLPELAAAADRLVAEILADRRHANVPYAATAS